MSDKIIALHGFLGLPKDFSGLELSNIIAPNIFFTPLAPFNIWARRFNSMVSKDCMLMGYSMGGRLALHCLTQTQNHYRAAIILAAHPGIKAQCLKDIRIKQDQLWGQKFLTLPWKAVMEEWNNRPALNSIAIDREEEDFCRQLLKISLNYFSLGYQQDLTPLINNLTLPILWLYSKNESDVICDIRLKHQLSEIIEIQGGHRFMFEVPEQITFLVRQFIYRINKN